MYILGNNSLAAPTAEDKIETNDANAEASDKQQPVYVAQTRDTFPGENPKAKGGRGNKAATDNEKMEHGGSAIHKAFQEPAVDAKAEDTHTKAQKLMDANTSGRDSKDVQFLLR